MNAKPHDPDESRTVENPWAVPSITYLVMCAAATFALLVGIVVPILLGIGSLTCFAFGLRWKAHTGREQSR